MTDRIRKFSDKTVYQIYPKSFRDTTGSGVGDLRGIVEKMDYFQFLGIDYIWITPFFRSPQRDNGYDVSDYYAIDPLYGTMKDLEDVVREADRIGVGIMLDMVFNHTSTDHEWFQKAIKGEERFRDYYIFKKGREGGLPPTNWESKFGGNAWEYCPSLDEYYLHLFDKTQADLNWENPEVRKELYRVLKFWKEKGIQGFRFDVVNLISKPDVYEDDEEGDGRRFYTDGPRIHEYLKEMVRESGIDGMVTVGEMSSTSIDNCIRYSNPKEKELSMCFNFHHLKVDYKNGNKWALMPCDFMRLKELLNAWQLGMQEGDGWNALFWSNHDQPRVLSRFGDDEAHRVESAKMLAVMMYLLRGTPYIYQGEEIGMTNAYFETIESYRDVESVNYFHILKEEGRKEEEIYKILKERSRDNARTPMQWNGDERGGFTSGRPWIMENPNHASINVEKEKKDGNSILHFYRKLIALRKEYDVISEGCYEPLLKEHPKVFAYKRSLENEEMLVFVNFMGEAADVECGIPNKKDYRVILENYGGFELEDKIVLKPYEAVVLIGANAK